MRRRTAPPDDRNRLHSLRQRIEQWRARRERRTRMPRDLWEEAVACAGVHGLWETAQVLRLNYSSLRDRVATSASERPAVPSGFVEFDLAAVAPPSPAELTVELHRRDGSKLCVHLPSGARAELLTMVERFLGGER